MIGDAAARGKVKSTTKPGPEFKKKNSKGQSFKTLDNGRESSDGGGGHETASIAERSTKGMRPGTGGRDRQNSKDQQAHKLVAHDQGSIIDQWCRGKRGSYK
jgi:hypothetical protein